MTTRTQTSIRSAASRIFRVALIGSLAATAPVLAEQGARIESDRGQAEHDHAAPPARLVQLVRDATRPFIDVNAATAAGYGPFLGCVSGPDHGAMGVHFVNGPLVGDGELDASRPEALIYEPSGDRMRLAGVEFIVDAATWLAHHPAPPVLEGQTFQFVDSPNRYALPPFFELHVWAWRQNPDGAFVDWNTRVTCERQ
jgi:hypothetical protein